VWLTSAEPGHPQGGPWLVRLVVPRKTASDSACPLPKRRPDYNWRVNIENGIAELKHELGGDGFRLSELFATQSAFRAV
jgi:hypothetical protein